MLYLAFLGLLYIHQSSAQDCSSLSVSSGSTYRETCIGTEGCEWDDTGNDGLCGTTDGYGDSSCCSSDTVTSTTTTQAVTTTAATTSCPVATTCISRSTEACCDELTACTWDPNGDALCGSPDQGTTQCCYTVTTTTEAATTTTEATTTEAATTATTSCPIPTTCISRSSEPCCDELTACIWNPNGNALCGSPDQGTAQCCYTVTTTTTEAVTTTEAATTTTEAATTTTEAATTTETVTTTETATTTESATTTETESATTTSEAATTATTESGTTESEESSTTEENIYPTPKPTMKSAMKWEMIHPGYKGGDGELLWHVYYGDFSNDQRFDDFRSKEMWNADEIRPILKSDVVFKRYVTPSREYKKGDAVISDTTTSYGTYLVGLSILFVIIFAIWYKYTSSNDKKHSEYTPLLQEDKVQYGH